MYVPNTSVKLYNIINDFKQWLDNNSSELTVDILKIVNRLKSSLEKYDGEVYNALYKSNMPDDSLEVIAGGDIFISSNLKNYIGISSFIRDINDTTCHSNLIKDTYTNHLLKELFYLHDEYVLKTKNATEKAWFKFSEEMDKALPLGWDLKKDVSKAAKLITIDGNYHVYEFDNGKRFSYDIGDPRLTILELKPIKKEVIEYVPIEN